MSHASERGSATRCGEQGRISQSQEPPAPPLFLGIDGGATHSTASVADAAGQEVARSQAGPANLQLLRDDDLVAVLRALAAPLPPPSSLAIGLAGARTESDRQRIRQAAGQVWPGIPCYATNDLETALLAAPERPRGPAGGLAARVLVLSGTGSCCFGRAQDGRTQKVGGWGHILGDRGSGYDLALRALRQVLAAYDRTGRWLKLGQRLLRQLQWNSPEDLVGWAHGADKRDVAALTTEVFAAWQHGDRMAGEIVEAAAHHLVQDATACARRLTVPSARVQFVLAGGVLLKQPRFAARVGRLLRQAWPNSCLDRLDRPSVWGAVRLARLHAAGTATAGPLAGPPRLSSVNGLPEASRAARPPAYPALAQLIDSPTERRHPRSTGLDRLSLADAIRLMLEEDRRIPPALLREADKLKRALGWIVRAFRRGGRLFYVGAGTSGRLGVLDASECPPTFRVSPDQVQGIMAGGQRALWTSIEGAEDDAQAGADAVRFRGVTSRDIVVGIAASGRTPFVWGALHEAHRRRATTILLCFNPHLRVPRERRPDLVIAPNVGPEILTGSTRLKAGTATKTILNLFTTLAMVRLGKVVSNLMVDVNPANVKLRDRAVRIVRELTGVDALQAMQALEQSGWVVKAALRRCQKAAAVSATRRA